MIKKLEFRACISPIMSGIRTGGDGMRVSIDIPESDVIDATALIALRNCPLKITVEVDDSPAATRIVRPEEKAATASLDAQGEASEAKGKKSSKPKGPHGKFWQELFRPDQHGASFFGEPNIREWLNQSRELDESDKAVLHRIFGVSSMSFVSPDAFVAHLKVLSEETGLPMGNAIKMVTQAEEKVSRQ